MADFSLFNPSYESIACYCEEITTFLTSAYQENNIKKDQCYSKKMQEHPSSKIVVFSQLILS